MPILRGAASDVTRIRGLQSSVVADPVRKSASYIPAQPQLLFDIRSSLAGRGVFPSQSVLQAPIAKVFENPRHKGLVVGPPVIPRITVNLGSTDFVIDSAASVTYSFGSIPPPASIFQAVVIGGTNVENIRGVTLSDTLSRGLLGSVTISVAPTLGTFTSDPNNPIVNTLTSGLFGYTSVVTFTDVPSISNLSIIFAES